jgi:hypothetical protein
MKNIHELHEYYQILLYIYIYIFCPKLSLNLIFNEIC